MMVPWYELEGRLAQLVAEGYVVEEHFHDENGCEVRLRHEDDGHVMFVTAELT